MTAQLPMEFCYFESAPWSKAVYTRVLSVKLVESRLVNYEIGYRLKISVLFSF